jgi:hypothetical protein
MYDIIGDIHGHADELLELLERMGYDRRRGHYSHPHRRAVFVGDFIDRGPQIREVLQIVRPMVDAGSAHAVMGNHEFNAIAYHTRNPGDNLEFLREHTEKNVRQHLATIRQLTADELYDVLEWFRELPLWMEADGIRVVHACWDRSAIDVIENAINDYGRLTTEFMQRAARPGTKLYDAVEVILKGKEVSLPDGVSFKDKDDETRTKTRVKWFVNPGGMTFRDYSLPPRRCIPDKRVPDGLVGTPYAPSGPPVFFGHYWLKSVRPEALGQNVACVDFSVARGGVLCAYRWSGERILSDDHFLWIPARPRRR